MHCRNCGCLGELGESITCEDCSDKLYASIRSDVLKEIVRGVRHLIREEGYTCGESEHILSFLKEMK